MWCGCFGSRTTSSNQVHSFNKYVCFIAVMSRNVQQDAYDGCILHYVVRHLLLAASKVQVMTQVVEGMHAGAGKACAYSITGTCRCRPLLLKHPEGWQYSRQLHLWPRPHWQQLDCFQPVAFTSVTVCAGIKAKGAGA